MKKPEPKAEESWITLTRDKVTQIVSSVEPGELVDEKEDAPMKIKLGALLTGLGTSRRGFYYRTKLHYQMNVQSNSAAGKYLLQLGGTNGAYLVNNVSNGGEWTSFNSVFEECFIHQMTVQFQPFNQFLGNYVNSTSTNIQTSGATIAAYQHNQGAATDAMATFYQLLNSQQSRHVNLGRPFSFSWRNIEKFSKDGPVGDATTAQNTQSWINMTDISKYGGYIVACLPLATNATPAALNFGQNVYFGIATVSWDISFRYRD